MTEIYGKGFPTVPEGSRVDFPYEQLVWALKTLHGNHCHVPNCKRQMPYEVIVEHINNDNSDYDPLNLRLACRSCNQKEREFQPEGTKNTGNPYTKISSDSETVNYNAETITITNKRQRQRLSESWTNSPPQFRKGIAVYEYARTYLYIEISRSPNKVIDYETAKWDICAKTACKPETATKSLDVLTRSNKYSKFKLTDDDKGITFNDGYKDEFGTEEDREIDAEAQRQLLEEERKALAKAKIEIEQKKDEQEELKQEHGLSLALLSELYGLNIEKILQNYQKRKAQLQSPNADWIICVVCGQPRPINREQLVCAICKPKTVDVSSKSASGDQKA